jgi:hypothetical protein
MNRLTMVRGIFAVLVVLGFSAAVSADDAKGTIKSIFADKKEIVVKGVVKDTTYELTKDARVWVDGKESKITDLKENDKIHIEYLKSGDRHMASEVRGLRKCQEATGTVRGTLAEKNHLIIKGVLKDTTYHLEKDATVWVNGKKVNLADLRENDSVRITFEERGDVLIAHDVFMTTKR